MLLRYSYKMPTAGSVTRTLHGRVFHL